MTVKIVRWMKNGRNPAIEVFFKRPAFDEKAEAAARGVLADIRANGDRAVRKYARRFNGADLRPSAFRVTAAELARAETATAPAFRAAVKAAHRRVAAFAKAGLRKDWSLRTSGGGRLGERFAPLDRVGVCVPGGAAPLASTAIMTATFARVAGVKEIVACTPCDRKGRVNPVLLYALKTAGSTEIYRVGGIQGVGLMAYGTKTVRKVQKIVGPGGAYVTAAKRQVYGHVALDLVAGPSEIAVLADDSAEARYVAADLLSQAEHGTGLEKTLLVTPSARLAAAVARELEIQTATLSRRQAIRNVMKNGMLLVVAPDLAAGMDLCNRFAPEHLELLVRKPEQWLKKVRCAGAAFVGPWSPESAGDFAAGPSHVLPTGGAAAMFSGLMGDDFRRRTSFIAYTRADLRSALPIIEAFGAVEGLDAHARSARIRFEKVRVSGCRELSR